MCGVPAAGTGRAHRIFHPAGKEAVVLGDDPCEEAQLGQGLQMGEKFSLNRIGMRPSQWEWLRNSEQKSSARVLIVMEGGS